MDIFDSCYYKINKWFLWYSGLWPYQSPKGKRLTLTLVVLGVCNFLIPQVIYVLKFMNLDNLLTCMPTCVGGMLLVGKLSALNCKRNEIKYVIDEVRENWSIHATGMELEILKNYANVGRKYTLVYGLLAVPPVVIYNLYQLSGPILDFILPLNESRPRALPHPAEYFVDQDRYFYLLMFIEYFSYTVAIILFIGSDTMYIVLIQHCCGLFAILRYFLEHTLIQEIGSKKNAMSMSEFNKLGCRHMVQCIRLHIKTKRFAKLISSLFTTFLSIDIFCGIIMHSTASVMIIIYMNQPAYVIKFGGVLITQSLRLFLSSWPGQELMDHSVATSAYSGIWYHMSVKARKLLLILIMDGQKPFTLTIAKLYVINLDSYGMIMRTSLSYCTVMASLHNSSVQ